MASKPARPAAALLPCREQLAAQRPEAFRGHRREQRPLVGEVAVERGARDADAGADLAQGQALDAVAADGGERFVEQGAAQVAMMVGAAGLARGARRWCHPPHPTRTC